MSGKCSTCTSLLVLVLENNLQPQKSTQNANKAALVSLRSY